MQGIYGWGIALERAAHRWPQGGHCGSCLPISTWRLKCNPMFFRVAKPIFIPFPHSGTFVLSKGRGHSLLVEISN